MLYIRINKYVKGDVQIHIVMYLSQTIHDLGFCDARYFSTIP